MKKNNFLFLAMAVFFITFGINTAQATSFIRHDFEDAQGDGLETVMNEDNWESFNRTMFGFNKVVYKYILGPVVKVYDFVVPDKVEGSIGKFFHNVETPVRVFNNIFQGEWKDSGTELGRFAINTTIGIGGFFDPAESQFGIEMQDEDFGQTLASYGMGAGPYVVWPIFGPATVRDTVGSIVDFGLNPLNWFLFVDVVDPKMAVYVAHEVEGINSFSYEAGDNYLRITDTANDPYLAIQNEYIQIRERKIDE